MIYEPVAASVRAWRFDGTVDSMAGVMAVTSLVSTHPGGKMLVQARDGATYAYPGDWIVELAPGEFRVVKSYDFSHLYRPATEHT